MRDLTWSGAEKKIARRGYEATLDSAFANVIADFKARAAEVKTPEEMWAIEGYLREQRREMEQTFDFRHSQLPWVFARLISQGYLDETQLGGLSEEKLQLIRRKLTWLREESPV